LVGKRSLKVLVPECGLAFMYQTLHLVDAPSGAIKVLFERLLVLWGCFYA
jgi:hypothetical protein